MFTIIRTDSENSDFINLVKQLDADLAIRDGSDNAFYAQYNKIDTIKHAIVVYLDKRPVACGAMKRFAPGTMEVKRMFTLPENRGQGAALKILAELEEWAHELSYKTCILETGKRQPEAIALYKKAGYNTIPNYGQYAGIENSVCFEKQV